MEQNEASGMEIAHASTPRDWVKELARRARGERVELTPEEARRLALTLSGLSATVEQLEACVHRLAEQVRPAPSWRCVTGPDSVAWHERRGGGQ